MSRGAVHWVDGPDETANLIGLKPELSGIKTEDEGLYTVQHKYWLESMKRGINAEQIPVLVVRDRSGQTADFQLSVLDAVHVCEKLEPLVDRDAILCTDSASVYAVFARTTGIAHRTINVRRGMRVVGGVFHIQNVNAYDSRLKSWMRRFHGVATQYLENYLGWRRLIERYAHTISPSACLAEAVGRPINS